jgi:hypothetical protein
MVSDLEKIIGAAVVCVLAYLGFEAFKSYRQGESDGTGFIKGVSDWANGIADNFSNARNYVSGSPAENAFNNDPAPWNLYVAPEVNTGLGPDGNPVAWADYFGTPQEIQAAQGSISSNVLDSGANWMWQQLFGPSNTSQMAGMVPAGYPDYPVNPSGWGG